MSNLFLSLSESFNDVGSCQAVSCDQALSFTSQLESEHERREIRSGDELQLHETQVKELLI